MRLVVESLREWTLRKQALAIQAGAGIRELTITPGAMYILSAVAGRRVPDPVRWVLLDSLGSILSGGLQNTHAERQDLLAPTFGELLGTALLALEVGGEVEIIRLLDSHVGTSPDFLLLQYSGHPSGPVAHLLECKGMVEDVHNINGRKAVDVCQHIRTLRNEGIEQLDEVNLKEVSHGASIRSRVARFPFALAETSASKNLTVLCIPDGRIPIQLDPADLSPVNRDVCRNVGCVQCMTGTTQPPMTNLICVIHREKMAQGAAVAPGLADFLKKYRMAQQAVWAGSDPFFTSSFDGLRASLDDNDWPPETRRTLVYMAATLLEAAAARQMRTAEVSRGLSERLADDEVKRILDEIIVAAGSSPGKESDPVTLEPGEFAGVARSGENEGNRTYLLRDFRPYAEGGAAPGVTIYGTLDSRGGISLIRLCAGAAGAHAYDALKDYTEELVEMIRNGLRPHLRWRREYARLDQSEIEFGVSWDQFPYPHPDGKRPGITAWVSAEGRAEVVVRRLLKNEA